MTSQQVQVSRDPVPSDLGCKLPRLLVVSDVSPDRTGGGALVLYRLLRQYPVGKLMVVTRQSDYWCEPVGRIPGVEYQELVYRIPRLIFNRFNPFWPLVMTRYIRRWLPQVKASANEFHPEAVLSVSHDYLWFLADVIASRYRVPHHVVLHDDWPSMQTLSQPEWVRSFVRRACERVCARVLRRARSRFYVSPGMQELNARVFGFDGKVLYPSRGEDSPFARVRVRPAQQDMFVVAYAGMIHNGSTAASLRSMSNVLAGMGGRLDLYVPYPADKLVEWNLNGTNVRLEGFHPAAEMAGRVAATAHALFLPASFENRMKVDVSTLFPSKLADYTAIGLPILIWGPAYSSVARWATDNPGATELVTDPDPVALISPLGRLAVPEYAHKVAAAGIEAGIRYFDAAAVRDKFLSTLATD